MSRAATYVNAAEIGNMSRHKSNGRFEPSAARIPVIHNNSPNFHHLNLAQDTRKRWLIDIGAWLAYRSVGAELNVGHRMTLTRLHRFSYNWPKYAKWSLLGIQL